VDAHGRAGRRRLRLEDHGDGGDGKDEEDDREGDGPGDLEEGVAVDLLGKGLPRLFPEAEAGPDQARLHRDADAERPPRSQHEAAVGDPPDLGLRLYRRHGRVPQRPAARRKEQRHGDEQERRGHAGEQPLAHRLLYLGDGPGFEAVADTAAATAARCRSNTVTQLRAARASTMRSGIAVQSTSLGRRRREASRRQRITKKKERAWAPTEKGSTTASTT